jgi:hypothetical protein
MELIYFKEINVKIITKIHEIEYLLELKCIFNFVRTVA